MTISFAQAKSGYAQMSDIEDPHKIPEENCYGATWMMWLAKLSDHILESMNSETILPEENKR